MAPVMYGVLFGLGSVLLTRLTPQPVGAIILWGFVAIQLALGAQACWRRAGLPFASAAMAHGARAAAQRQRLAGLKQEWGDMTLSVPELVVVLMVGLVWVIPVAAGIWALIALHRIRTTQEDMRSRLAAIERLIQTVRSGER